MKTLIVEDDFTNRLLLQGYLSPYGECHIAVNGGEAVEAFRLARGMARPYDLICLDIVMPGLDGHKVLKEIRQQEQADGVLVGDGVKIVMITGRKDKDNVFGAFHNICDAYLVKPVERSQLQELLKGFKLIE